MTRRSQGRGRAPLAQAGAPAARVSWHARGAEAVLDALGTSPTAGLTRAEASRRLQVHDANRLPSAARLGPFARFLLQFHNPLSTCWSRPVP